MKGTVKIANKRAYQPIANDIPIYIGRPSVLGNPFYLKTETDRERVINNFAEYLSNEMKSHSSLVKRKIEELRTKFLNGENLVLICFCYPKKCHGDLIKREIEKESIGE